MNGDLGMPARGSNPRATTREEGRRLKAAFLRRVAHPVGALGGRAASPGDQISGLPEKNSPPKGGLAYGERGTWRKRHAVAETKGGLHFQLLHAVPASAGFHLR